MNGLMIVAGNDQEAARLLADSRPKVIREWKMTDFADAFSGHPHATDAQLARGMTAFVKARCNQCHIIAGHGANLGPDLVESIKTLKGARSPETDSGTVEQDPREVSDLQFVTTEGQVITGVIMKETDDSFEVATNLLTPHSLTTIPKKSIELRQLPASRPCRQDSSMSSPVRRFSISMPTSRRVATSFPTTSNITTNTNRNAVGVQRPGFMSGVSSAVNSANFASASGIGRPFGTPGRLCPAAPT